MSRTIICGSRRLSGCDLIEAALLHAGWLLDLIWEDDQEVVEGGAAGIDRSAAMWARRYSKEPKTFPAEWTAHGKAAGGRRNEQMAVYASEQPGGRCLAIPDHDSRGTWDMVRRAQAHGLDVFVFECLGWMARGGAEGVPEGLTAVDGRLFRGRHLQLGTPEAQGALALGEGGQP